MSGEAYDTDDTSRAFEPATAADPSSRVRWVSRILPLIIFLIGTVGLAILFWPRIVGGDVGNIPLGFTLILSIFLSLLPAMICVVKNSTRRRQLNRLGNLVGFRVSRTAYYRTAVTYVTTTGTVAVDGDFGPPMFVYFFIVFTGFVAFLIGFAFQNLFIIPSVLLAGLHPLADQASLKDYQGGTFVVISMAFMSSYIYSLGRLLDRVNNNDLYPISLYYYAARVVIACAVAAVFRHSADAMGMESSSIMLLIAFGIGFAPDLFIVAVTRRAFQAVKIWGSRDDPASETRPPSLPLLMIDDLSRDKVDRLSELGIDNAQVLARQNPFLLLPRLPYDLGLLVDWIGQAQLYALVKDEALKKLRAIYIRDVFDLRIRLASDTARAEVCAALGIEEVVAASLERQLDQDPSFQRLAEVRHALLP